MVVLFIILDPLKLDLSERRCGLSTWNAQWGDHTTLIDLSYPEYGESPEYFLGNHN